MLVRSSSSTMLEHEDEAPLIAEESNTVISDGSSQRKKVIGGFLAVMAGFTFTWYSFLIKTLQLDFVDVVFLRSVLQMVIFGLLVSFSSQSFWPQKGSYESKKEYLTDCCLLLFQGLCTGGIMLFGLMAVTFIPIGDAITVIYFAPFFTMILAAIFLGHRLRLYKVTFASLLTCGIILVVRPPFIFSSYSTCTSDSSVTEKATAASSKDDVHDLHYYLGVLAGLAGALTASLLTVTVNRLKNFSQNVLIFYGGIGALISVLICFSFDEKSKIFHDFTNANFPQLLLLTSIGLIACFMSMKSFQLVSPAVASVLMSLEIIFSYMVQAVVQQDMPTATTLGGGFLVILSAIFIPIESIIVNRLPSPLKNIF